MIQFNGNKSAAKTESAFASMLEHCLATPNANVCWLVSGMESFAQAGRALQAFNFMPVEVESNQLICEMEMPAGCPAAGTKARITVRLTSRPEDKLASVPTFKIEL